MANRTTPTGPEKTTPGRPGDYEVGYGKPPRSGQFRKGESGNRKGRPARSRNLKTDLRDVLDETLTLSVGGQAVRIPARRAMLIALRNKALKGDVRAINLLVNILERLMPETLVEDVKDTITRDDLEIFDEAIDRHLDVRLAKIQVSETRAEVENRCHGETS